MRDVIAGAIIGFILCVVLIVAMEMRGKLRHKLRGNYFDARASFSIERVGGKPEVRSAERVDKLARRLGRIKRWRYADADDAS